MISLLLLRDKRKRLYFFITMARPKIILNPNLIILHMETSHGDKNP